MRIVLILGLALVAGACLTPPLAVNQVPAAVRRANECDLCGRTAKIVRLHPVHGQLCTGCDLDVRHVDARSAAR